MISSCNEKEEGVREEEEKRMLSKLPAVLGRSDFNLLSNFFA